MNLESEVLEAMDDLIQLADTRTNLPEPLRRIVERMRQLRSDIRTCSGSVFWDGDDDY